MAAIAAAIICKLIIIEFRCSFYKKKKAILCGKRMAFAMSLSCQSIPYHVRERIIAAAAIIMIWTVLFVILGTKQ